MANYVCMYEQIITPKKKIDVKFFANIISTGNKHVFFILNDQHGVILDNKLIEMNTKVDNSLCDSGLGNAFATMGQTLKINFTKLPKIS